jgi:hypothetical protein
MKRKYLLLKATSISTPSLRSFEKRTHLAELLPCEISALGPNVLPYPPEPDMVPLRVRAPHPREGVMERANILSKRL